MSNENLKWIAGNDTEGGGLRIYSIWDTEDQAIAALERHQKARAEIFIRSSNYGDRVWAEFYMTDGDLGF